MAATAPATACHTSCRSAPGVAPSIASKPAHERSFDKLAAGNVAEVTGGHVGQKCKSHIGWRRPVGDGRNGMLLEIVRGEPVIVRADEGLEEPPCAARDFAQEVTLSTRQPWRRAGSMDG